ncbi:glycine/betaine ABC transporter [Aneurinibacillus migulanus]|uniref:glycine betaine ABC transporter substrate-binding protein n=1 Tax=Aneurinibacillus migulanus TaxID=47500 RepID=UPI0005BC9E23|nr:glycine betaine ABC transporter substrate-binding protein [Aneurinibacillus migulanus]KIV54572.1 glycine/betaine ABC transporter [Aneurinibacillus migulanus]KPD08031.1 glycine/betaine ABC transporter [Aneurinibacillus migulanus]
MFKKLICMLTPALLALSLTACGGSGQTNATNGAPASVGESVNYKIVGIDPGAGLMKATTKAIDTYGLEKWNLVEGSGAAMTAALKKAYDKKEPIIVTGWTPHWMFSKFDLKYLEDSKGVYGEAENIHTIARNGLKEEHPNAYKILDQFHWTSEDMGTVMSMIEDGAAPDKAAAKWVEEHDDLVKKWTNGAGKGNGEKLTIAYVAWASEIASTNVIAKVLKDMGFDVTLRQVEAGPMWAGVADGSVDAHVAGWLPITHADYVSKFKGKFEDLGTNLEGTKLGLVVPKYMDITSIEDLKEK